MRSKKPKDNWNQKKLLCKIVEFGKFDLMDIYTTMDYYWWLLEKIKDEWWEWVSQWIIDDSLLQLKIEEKTGNYYTIRVSFQKVYDREEKEAERINIENRRKTSLIYNNKI